MDVTSNDLQKLHQQVTAIVQVNHLFILAFHGHIKYTCTNVVFFGLRESFIGYLVFSYDIYFHLGKGIFFHEKKSSTHFIFMLMFNLGKKKAIVHLS